MENLYKIEKIEPLRQQEGAVDCIKATILLNSRDKIFSGHFPGHPILPGVCMLEMIKKVAQEHLKRPLLLGKITSAKFLETIKPQENSKLFFEVEFDALKFKATGRHFKTTPSGAEGECAEFIKVKGSFTDATPKDRICVVVPTYNNEKSLLNVLSDVSNYSSEIYVVNDGSTDSTAELLKRLPSNIKVLTHPKNLGKGAALRTGLQAASADGFDYAITIDSDGQHYASDIPLFMEEIAKREKETLFVGSRDFTSENMPGKNSFANKFSNFWFKVETGVPLRDTQSGFRSYPLKSIDFTKSYYTNKYEFELEVIVYAAWSGIQVKNIPINVLYHTKEERISHFKPLRDFTRISILNTILVLVAFFYIWPRNFFRALTKENIINFWNSHVLHSGFSNSKIVKSIMLGVFMGILPIWGYQMIVAALVAHFFKLSKVITVVASNISIPPCIPFILYGSYLVGGAILGEPSHLGLGELTFGNLSLVLKQYLVGSIPFAAVCSLIAGLLSAILLFLFRKERRRG